MLGAHISRGSTFLNIWISNLVNYRLQECVNRFFAFVTTVTLAKNSIVIAHFGCAEKLWEALTINIFQEASIADIFY